MQKQSLATGSFQEYISNFFTWLGNRIEVLEQTKLAETEAMAELRR